MAEDTPREPEETQQTPETGEAPADQPAPEAPAGDQPEAAEAPAGDQPEAAEAPAGDQPEAAEAPAGDQPEAAEVDVEGDRILTEEELEDEVEKLDETPRVKPEIPGADLEVDIVREDDLLRGDSRWSEEEDTEPAGEAVAEADEEAEPEPIADAAIDLAAGARYAATG